MNAHAAVWLDQERAKIFFFDRDAYEEKDFQAPLHHFTSHSRDRETHHRGESREQKEYFESLAKPLADAHEILILGPGTAKTQFLRHLHKHEAKLEERIVGIESSDHPTSGQIAAHVRQYFREKAPRAGTSAQ